MTAPVLLDSAAEIRPKHAGRVVVTGSHGGASAARFALVARLAGVVFNDAGVGKDGAGVSGLALMQQAGVPALAASHDSARIGDAADMLANGVVSHANAAAAALGVAPGMRVAEAVGRLGAR